MDTCQEINSSAAGGQGQLLGVGGRTQAFLFNLTHSGVKILCISACVPTPVASAGCSVWHLTANEKHKELSPQGWKPEQLLLRIDFNRVFDMTVDFIKSLPLPFARCQPVVLNRPGSLKWCYVVTSMQTENRTPAPLDWRLFDMCSTYFSSFFFFFLLKWERVTYNQTLQ